MRRAQSTASMPVGRRPPWVYTSQPSPGSSPRRLASTATTMHWEPKRRDASSTNSGRCTAAVLMETLSAPASSSLRTSSITRTPPPTVSGMNTFSAVARTTSMMMSRSSLEAVMSRKVSSSAPWASYTEAFSTGSPASRSSTKLTPLTTRPDVHVQAGDDPLGDHLRVPC